MQDDTELICKKLCCSKIRLKEYIEPFPYSMVVKEIVRLTGQPKGRWQSKISRLCNTNSHQMPEKQDVVIIMEAVQSLRDEYLSWDNCAEAKKKVVQT